MADESELRRMLEREAAGISSSELDTGRLVRRSRARRLPRQLAAGSALALAVVGVGVGTVTGIRLLDPPPEVSSAGGGAESSDEDMGTMGEDAAPESSGDGSAGGGSAGGGIDLAPAYKVNLCGGTLGIPSQVGTGVSVEVRFPDEADASGIVRGSVEITNDSGEPIRGVMSDVAATTLSQDGVVLWHTPRVERALPVDLDPGEGTTLEASFEPRICTAADEGRADFPPDLPTVEPGRYAVSVAFDIERQGGVVLQVVSGTEPILLH